MLMTLSLPLNQTQKANLYPTIGAIWKSHIAKFSGKVGLVQKNLISAVLKINLVQALNF